ncbi:MAG: rhamnan synthesis F family protein [Lachnospiraceae bacterium]|nr:rhamnan synthesis F family protein [Lachnospiraceae bacterium]
MNNKRLIIYYASSSKKRLERYSEYFLRKVLDYFENILLVSVTEKLIVSDPDIKDKLVHNAVVEGNVHCLSAYNIGFHNLDCEMLNSYSEVVCISDDIMGPVCDVSDLFETMERSRCDVWGIAKQHPTPLNYLDYSGNNLQPEYLLPFFIAFKIHVLENPEVRVLFDNIDTVERFQQSLVDSKALYLTSELNKLGYSCTSFMLTEDIGTMYYNPLLFIPEEMISLRKCPVFLKESFVGDYDSVISNMSGDASFKLYGYLRDRTDYDVDMIWDTILKSGHQQDINHNMHLNYILSSIQCDEHKLNRILKEKQIALVMHLYFLDLLDNSLYYAQSMPESSDIFITTNTLEKKKAIEDKFQKLSCRKLEVRLIENRGRDVSSLLVGVKDVIMKYDYVCFVHDKKSTQVVPGSLGSEFGYQCFENLLGSREYVANVISAFYDNKRLGILSPVYPIHGNYFSVNGDFDWGGNYDITIQLASKLGLTVPICHEKSPVAPLGTMFWFRPRALQILYDYNWEYGDFPQEPNGTDATLLHAIERIYSFVAQQQGFYPAIVCNELFANISITNLTDILQGLNRELKKYKGYVSYQQMLYVIKVLGYEASENERLQKELVSYQNRIDELIPQTSLKWQLENRIKRKLLPLRGRKEGTKNDTQ